MFKQKPKTPTFFKRASLLAILAVVTMASFVAAFSRDEKALAATSSTINFQARLLTAAGNIVPDGQYNVEFKLYDAASGGTSVWTETRTTSDKVRVVNGYLTVNLGSVTAFGSINWDQELWLTMNIGGTGAASWDGEMTPRLKLTAVPYAFTAGKLVGGSGSNTTTLDAGTPSGNNTIHLPAESGTLCIQASANCGFALSSGGTNYIQNQFSAAQTTANFWISGTGRMDTALQSPAIRPTANGVTAIQFQNVAGTSTAMSIDTTNNRVSIGNGGTAFAPQEALDVIGNIQVRDAATATKGYRLRTTGGSLDFEASGADLYLSNWSGANYTGTQRNYLRLESGANVAHAVGSWQFATSPSGTTRHTIDGTTSANVSFNQDGEATDFSVQGDTDANLFFIQGSSDRVGIGTATPGYKLDVAGDINILTGSSYRINGTAVCTAAGCTPAAGSTNYIQNGTSLQTANYYIQSAAANSVAAIIRGAAAQTSSLLQLLDGSTGYTIAQFSNNGYLTLGSDSIAKAGQITLNDGTASNTFSTTIVVPTALTASRTITLPDETGTICIQSSTTCGFAPTTGSASYIQNQNAGQQASSNFWISGTGRADTALQSPLFDTPTAVALNIGTTNATGINLNKDTTITGALTQSGGILDLTGNGASTIKTSSGALSIRANGTNILTLNTSGAGTVNVGVDNTTAINLGGGSDVARTINVGNPASGTANQTVNIGTQHGTSVTTIQGGSSGTAIAITPASGGSVVITTAGAGNIALSSGAAGSFTTSGALTMTAGAASTWSTSSGALTLTSAAAATWSTSAGSLTVQAAGANSLNLNTGGAGTVALGDTNSTTINIGRGSDIARNISIGNAGSTTAQTVTIGSTGSTSTTTIQGGTGAGAIALNAGSNGSIGLTTTGTGAINLTSGGAITAAATGNASYTAGGSLTLTAGGGSTWSTTSGNLTIQAATTNNLTLQTGGAGTVALGDQNSTTINIGRGSNIARTINIGTAGTSTAQTIGIGSTGSTSTTTIQGGTGAGAIALTTGTNGTIGLTSAGTGDINLTSADAGQFTTGTGALTLTAGAASTWSTTAGNLTIQAAGTSSLILNTVGAGTIALGDTNSTTINIGRGSDTARTINIGTAGTTTAQTITIGSTGSTSSTTINGGTGATAINLVAGTNGSINMTTTGTGKNVITSATQTVIRSSTNAITAFQIQNLANTPILNVDTTNARVGINTAAPNVDLDVVGVMQQHGAITSNTVGTDNNKWTKLASCSYAGQWTQCFTVFTITGGNNGTDNENTQATVSARVKQQNAMGAAPWVDVTVNGVARVITKDDIKAVTTVNTGGNTTVEIWGRITNIFEHWQVAPLINTTQPIAGQYSPWQWYSQQGFSAALPGGAQTDATYGTTYADTLIVSPASNTTAALNVLNASGGNMLTVDSTNGRVIVGRDDGLNGADAKLYFGDTANVANPWIGEANGTDSDILQLQGKNGINMSVATTQTNVLTLSATGAALFKNTADSTTAFQVQSQGSTPLFVIDSTTGGALHTLYATTASTGQTINITNASGTNTNGILINRNAAGGTTTNGLNITNTAGTLTNGLAFTGTIGTDIFRSSGILTLSGAGGIATASNVSIGLVGTPGAVLHVSSGAASDLFKVTDSTATAMDVFKIANDGYATFQNRADSTTAFRVLKQAGNALFTVDTTSNLVNISGAGTGLGGGRLTFGDNSYVYIGEYGSNDTDSMLIHGEEEIYVTTKYSATAMMYLDGGTGRIGINTEAPTETLTVAGNANVIATDSSKAYRWRTTGSQLDFEAGGANLYLSTWTNVGMSTSQRTHIVMQTDGQMLFNSIGAVSGTLRTLCIDNTTKTVKIGPTSTTCSSSSQRYKENIQSMRDSMGLDVINALRPVTYEYMNGSGNGEQIGLIAEEVYQVLPQIVELDENGQPNAINYEFLVANLTKGMQQQQVQINSLRQGLWDGGIVSKDTTFNGLVTFNGGVTFKGDATFDAKVGFNGKITYNPDTAGTIVMPHGKTSATVTFAQPYDQIPQISVSSSDYVSLKITDKTVNGFTITMKYPFAGDVNIDWVATQTSLPNQSGSNAPRVVVNEP